MQGGGRMLNRYLAGAAGSPVIIAALNICMHYLTAIGEAASIELKPPIALQPGRTIMDTLGQVDRDTPEPASPPARLPPLAPPEDPDGKLTFTGLKFRSTGPVVVTRAPALPDAGNSALTDITGAKPEYPLRASRIELEGFVAIRFDVGQSGLVEYVKLLESSSTMFKQHHV